MNDLVLKTYIRTTSFMQSNKGVAVMVLLGGLAVVSVPAMADDLPWAGPICKVANALKGPVASGVAVIAIVVSGLLMAVGELGGIFKTMLGLLAGISMAILADRWLGFIGGAMSC